MNIEIQNFISIFVFRYSPPWRFCAQICTIANVLIANIMFAVEVLTFTHLRKKKNLEKFEYRNTEFYFDFRFSIFAPLGVFVLKFVLKRTCSLRISCSQWRFSLSPIYERKTWKNLNIERQNFISIFVFRYSPPWRFCAQICTIANVPIANIMFAVEVLTFTHLRKTWNYLNIEIQNFISIFVFSIFAPLAFLCSNLYYSERAHCEYHVHSGGSHFHPSTKEKLIKI